VDAHGAYLDGSKHSTLRLLPDMPAKLLCSLLACDMQTRSELQNDQRFPSVNHVAPGVEKNADGSNDEFST
jgi:hypothetical protein